jgi:hypothetical protein
LLASVPCLNCPLLQRICCKSELASDGDLALVSIKVRETRAAAANTNTPRHPHHSFPCTFHSAPSQLTDCGSRLIPTWPVRSLRDTCLCISRSSQLISGPWLLWAALVSCIHYRIHRTEQWCWSKAGGGRGAGPSQGAERHGRAAPPGPDWFKLQLHASLLRRACILFRAPFAARR